MCVDYRVRDYGLQSCDNFRRYEIAYFHDTLDACELWLVCRVGRLVRLCDRMRTDTGAGARERNDPTIRRMCTLCTAVKRTVQPSMFETKMCFVRRIHDPRTPTHKRGSVCKSEVKSQARPPRKPQGATNAPHRHSICNKTLSRVLVHALPFPIRSPLISPSPGHTRQRPKTAEAVISPEHAPGCRRSIRTGTL